MQILDWDAPAQAWDWHIVAELLNELQICHHSKGMGKVHVLNGPTRANKGNHWDHLSACVGVWRRRQRRAAVCGMRRRRRSSGLVSRYDNDLHEDHLFSVLWGHAREPKKVERCFYVVGTIKYILEGFGGACPTHTNKHIIWDTKRHFCRVRICGSLVPKNGQNACRNADTQHA